jgi:hypothetical protein
MYEDGTPSLADTMRENLPKEIRDFYDDGIKKKSAHNFSSVVSWRLEKFYPGAKEYSPQLDALLSTLAHAAKVTCGKLTKRHTVLCVYVNERGVKIYDRHKVGACPHILQFFKEINYERGT